MLTESQLSVFILAGFAAVLYSSLTSPYGVPRYPNPTDKSNVHSELGPSDSLSNWRLSGQASKDYNYWYWHGMRSSSTSPREDHFSF